MLLALVSVTSRLKLPGLDDCIDGAVRPVNLANQQRNQEKLLTSIRIESISLH